MRHARPFQRLTLNTVALIVRVYRGELPYLGSFVRHYSRMGITVFYVIINDKADEWCIRNHEAFSGVDCRFFVHDLSLIGGNKFFNLPNNFDIVLPQIRQDFTLNVDVDEYLDLSGFGSIQEFLAENPCGVYRFMWLIANNDGLCDPELAFHGRTGKQMCRTNLIANINCHEFLLKHEYGQEKVFKKYILHHYWGRSFRDIMIKTSGQTSLRNAKNSTVEAMKQCCTPADLPGRFKGMAAMSRIEKNIRIPNHVGIDLAMEEDLLDQCFTSEDEDRLWVLYKAYRDSLDYDTHVRPLADRVVGIHEHISNRLCP